MVLAYHLIISAYGFWMPNERCGSWSDFVRSYELWRAGGDATKVDTRRSVAGERHDPHHRRATRAALARGPGRFTGRQAKAIAEGFADYCGRKDCRLHACAVLPDHAHVIVGRRRVAIETTCELPKGAATAELNRRGLHPFAGDLYRNGRLPTPWARKGWWVFLDSAEDVARATAYTDANPVKAGYRPQRWGFVTPFAM